MKTNIISWYSKAQNKVLSAEYADADEAQAHYDEATEAGLEVAWTLVLPSGERIDVSPE